MFVELVGFIEFVEFVGFVGFVEFVGFIGFLGLVQLFENKIVEYLFIFFLMLTQTRKADLNKTTQFVRGSP